MTGSALNYVSEVILAAENGNRPDAPDIVIVMSDGRGQDDINEHLSELWESGVTVNTFILANCELALSTNFHIPYRSGRLLK